MAQKYDWFDISNEQRTEWERLCPVNEFRIVRPDQLPSIIPRALTQKYDSVLIIASGSVSKDVAYYMVNGNRVDFKPQEVDQMPFGVAFVGNSAVASGSLIQHGRWSKRTTKPPPEFWTYVSSSGIGNCYPLDELPNSPSGSIQDLKIASQNDAFGNIVSILRRYVDEASNRTKEGDS